MEKTTNYEMFKKHPNNRDLDEYALGKLQKSISTKNLLEFRPILVNGKMEVIDGQHRLEAARRLGISIYYQVEKSSNSRDIILLNAYQKSWTKSDFFRFFVQDGKGEYLKLKNFMEKHNLTLRGVFAILRQRSGSGMDVADQNDFRNGTYKFPNEEDMEVAERNVERIHEVLSYLKDKIIGDKKFLNSGAVVKALCSLMAYQGFDFDVFIKKIPYRIETIHPCSRETDYVEMFKQVYNWKNHNPLGGQ